MLSLNLMFKESHSLEHFVPFSISKDKFDGGRFVIYGIRLRLAPAIYPHRLKYKVILNVR